MCDIYRLMTASTVFPLLRRHPLIHELLEPAASVPDIDIAFGIAGNDMDVGELARIVARHAEGRARDFLQGLAVQHMHPFVMAVGDIKEPLLLVARQRHAE